MGLGSRLLRTVRFIGRFCVFLRSGALISADAFYFLLFDWLVVGAWLGHGERPSRVLLVAILVLVVAWFLYWQVGTFILDPDVAPLTVGRPGWRNALYFSLVSFSALGYGNWAPEPVGWIRFVGAAESFLGIFSVVFFSITFAQRFTR